MERVASSLYNGCDDDCTAAGVRSEGSEGNGKRKVHVPTLLPRLHTRYLGKYVHTSPQIDNRQSRCRPTAQASGKRPMLRAAGKVWRGRGLAFRSEWSERLGTYCRPIPGTYLLGGSGGVDARVQPLECTCTNSYPDLAGRRHSHT